MAANKTPKLTLARPYAHAAFEYAVQHNDIKQWVAFMENIAMIAENASVQALITDPKIEQQNLIELFANVCKANMNEAKENFLKLISNKRRWNILLQIKEIFLALVADYEKKLDIEILSAMPLADEQRQKLIHVLTQRFHQQIEPHYHVDKSLLGGVVVRIGDVIIDGSLRAALNNLTAKLLVAV